MTASDEFVRYAHQELMFLVLDYDFRSPVTDRHSWRWTSVVFEKDDAAITILLENEETIFAYLHLKKDGAMPRWDDSSATILLDNLARARNAKWLRQDLGGHRMVDVIDHIGSTLREEATDFLRGDLQQIGQMLKERPRAHRHPRRCLFQRPRPVSQVFLDYRSERSRHLRRATSAGSFEYHVRLSPAAVEESIRAAVDHPRAGEAVIPGAFTGRRIVGRVDRGQFEVWVRRWSYDSLASRAFGKIAPTDSGSTVTVTINPPRSTRIGIPLILVGAALGGAPILLSVGYDALIVASMTAACLATALALWRAPLWGGFPSSEVDELHQFLDETLRASR